MTGSDCRCRWLWSWGRWRVRLIIVTSAAWWIRGEHRALPSFPMTPSDGDASAPGVDLPVVQSAANHFDPSVCGSPSIADKLITPVNTYSLLPLCRGKDSAFGSLSRHRSGKRSLRPCHLDLSAWRLVSATAENYQEPNDLWQWVGCKLSVTVVAVLFVICVFQVETSYSREGPSLTALLTLVHLSQAAQTHRSGSVK